MQNEKGDVRSQTVEIYLEIEGRNIREGMFLEGSMESGEPVEITEIPKTALLRNGNESVVIQVLTTNNEDLIAKAEYVKEFANQFNRSHVGVELTIVEDISEFVNERAAALWENGLVGLILVVLIITLFLDKRIAFFSEVSFVVIVLLSLPFAFVGVVIAHMIHGVTMNIFSVI